MKILLLFFLLFLNINISFWFSNIEKIKINNFIFSQSDYEKQKMILDKMLAYFKKQTDVDFLLSLKQKIIIKNLKNKKIFLQNNLNQKLQDKPLSCEVNSASLFATYLLKREVSEGELFEKIPKYEEPIQKTSSKFIWGNPYIEFVWKVNWKQTKNTNNFSWYWVYAYPVSKALKQIWVDNKIKKFNKYDIINSLLENKPVIFWYLWENWTWKADTNPFVWYTQNWDKINWYIWQHTWLIVWVSLFDNWNINEVYFYEWRNLDVQIMKYNQIKYQTSFFDMMIIWE